MSLPQTCMNQATRVAPKRSTGLLAAAAMLLVAGCGHRDGAPPRLERRLIEKDFSEQRFEGTWPVVDQVVLDFRDRAALSSLQIADLDFEITAQGLVGSSPGGDPTLVLPQAEHPWNQIAVEVNSEADTFLEVYWAAANETFSEARKKRVQVLASLEPVQYNVDLRRDLASEPAGIRLRVDPVAGKSNFTLRRIELTRQSASTAKVPGKPLTGVKVRLGGETREALVLSAGHPVDWPLSVPGRSSLEFGVAMQQAPRQGCVLRLTFRDQNEGEAILFERPYLSDERGWKDWKLPLDRLSGRNGTLRAEVISGRRGAPAALFWSNPVLGRSDRTQRRPNVILVSVDTLGSQHLSAYGAATVGDEFFSNLAKRGILFENAFSNSSLTNISHGSMLTGSLPLGADPFWVENAALTDLTLAEILRRNGYATAAFTGGVMVTEGLGFDRGFERFFQEDTLYKDSERSDIAQVLSRAQAWLEGAAVEPFFLFLHSYEVHTPYYLGRAGEMPADPAARHGYFTVDHMRGLNPVPLTTAGRFIKTLTPEGAEVTLEREEIGLDDLTKIRDVYRGEIALVGRTLESFFRYLEQRDLLENTVVVVTSDHGEAFFEHGLFEHGLLYDENLRVPLIIVAPGRVPAATRIRRYVSLVDLEPTILELAGVATPVPLDGSSLTQGVGGNTDADEASFYSFVAGDGFAWQSASGEKLIWRAALLQENFGRHELFNRENDPQERHSLLSEPGFIPKQLRPLVRKTLASMPGIHISLKSYPRGRYRLYLAGSGIHPDRVYGFGMRSGGFSKGEAGWSGEVELGDEPYLIVLMGRGPNAMEGILDLRLSDDSGVLLGRHLVRLADIGERPSILRATTTAQTLQLWRVSSPGGSKDMHRGLAPEEVERLRALGYLR